MNDKDNSEFPFIHERIKEKPFNVKRFLTRALLMLFIAVLFGLTAGLIFVSVVNHMVPEIQTVMVNIPSDEEISTVSRNTVSTDGAPGDTKGSKGALEGSDNSDSSDNKPATESENEAKPQETQYITNITERVSLTPDDYRELYLSLHEAAREASTSLVKVIATASDRDWFDNTYVNTNQTTGLIVANNGLELLILTDTVTSSNAEKLSVVFPDGNSLDAEVKSEDTNTGLQILAVRMEDISEETLSAISEAKLGNSWATNIIGTPVMAIGSPFGTPGAQAFGMITSNSQEIYLIDRNVRLINTDIYGSTQATGVLVTYEGDVLGIISQATSSKDMINLISAYSISDLKQLIEKLSNGTKEARLGIHGMTVTEQANSNDGVPYGAFVTSIVMDSPAMDAGIQSGDVITKIGTQPVVNMTDLTNALMKCQPGDKTVITVKRFSQGEYTEINFEVTLGEA